MHNTAPTTVDLNCATFLTQWLKIISQLSGRISDAATDGTGQRSLNTTYVPEIAQSLVTVVKSVALGAMNTPTGVTMLFLPMFALTIV